MSRKHFSLFHSFFLHTIKWKRHWKNYLIYWVFSKNSFDESLKKSYHEFSKNLNDTILQCCSVYEEFKIYFVFWYYRHLRNNHFFFLAYYSFKKWIVKKKKPTWLSFFLLFSLGVCDDSQTQSNMATIHLGWTWLSVLHYWIWTLNFMVNSYLEFWT